MEKTAEELQIILERQGSGVEWFSIELTDINGKVKVTDQLGREQIVDNDFHYYGYNIHTFAYWLNSVSTLKVFVFPAYKELLFYGVVRDGMHEEPWELTFVVDGKKYPELMAREVRKRLPLGTHYSFIAERQYGSGRIRITLYDLLTLTAGTKPIYEQPNMGGK